jgi:hypothetical protein
MKSHKRLALPACAGVSPGLGPECAQPAVLAIGGVACANGYLPDAKEGLLAPGATTEISINDYHASERPWLLADAVFERMGRDDE